MNTALFENRGRTEESSTNYPSPVEIEIGIAVALAIAMLVNGPLVPQVHSPS